MVREEDREEDGLYTRFQTPACSAGSVSILTPTIGRRGIPSGHRGYLLDLS